MSCAATAARLTASSQIVRRSSMKANKVTMRYFVGLLAVFAVFVFGTTEANADVAEAGWVAPESFIYDGLEGGTATEPVDTAEISDAIQSLKDEHALAVATPQAQADRADSVDAFADLGAADVIDLINEVFAEPLQALTTLSTDPLLTSESAPVFNAGSDTSARIDPPGEEDSELIVSETPMRNGDDQIVTGQLEADQSGFSPKAPLANVELPEQATGQIALSDVGVSFGFEGATGSNGRLVDAATGSGKEMVLYPNTQVDTDTAVTYTLGGVETFNYLRSEDSPESFALDYDLPEGASLSATADGGAIALNEEGEELVTVFPPYAVDAQGSDVPMTLSVNGNSIVLDVSHRGEDFAYPIMVDPVQHVRDWWTSGATPGFDGWSQGEVGSTNYNHSQACPSSLASVDPCGGTGSGVYTSAVPGSSYPAGSYGYWQWAIPGGASSSLTGATISSWRYRKGNTNPGWAFVNLTGTSSSYQFTDGGGGSGLNLTGASSGVKYLNAGLATSTANTIPTGASNWRYMRIAAYSATMTDGEAPTFTMSGAPTHWLKDNTNFTVTGNAADPGLGLGWIEAYYGGAWTNQWVGWCTGTYGAECPKNASPTMTFNTSGYANGVNGIYTRAKDIVAGTGHETVSGFNFSVDKDNPTISSISTLVANTNTAVTGPLDLTLGTSDPTSGVKLIEFFLDNEMISSTEAACVETQVCSLDPTMEIDLSGDTAGAHDWKVKVSDAAGNSTVKEGTMTLTPGDEPDASGEFSVEGDVIPLIQVEENGDVTEYSVLDGDPLLEPMFETTNSTGATTSGGGIFCNTTGPTPWKSAQYLYTYATSQCYGGTSNYQGLKVKGCIEHRNSHWFGDTWPDDQCKTKEYTPAQSVYGSPGVVNVPRVDCTGKDYRGHYIGTVRLGGMPDRTSHKRSNIIYCS